jgi:hypothetical protein
MPIFVLPAFAARAANGSASSISAAVAIPAS